MTSTEFKDWRASPQTKEVFNLIANRVQDLREDLGRNAGYHDVEDARRSGAIQALLDILSIEFEETQSQ